MCKKFLAILVGVMLCMGLSTTAMAQGEISPRLKYLTSTSASLSSSGSITVRASGNTSVSDIDITVSVQESDGTSWTEVDSWSTESTAGDEASFSDSTSAMTSGSSYRVKAVIKAYTATGSESITKYSSTVTAR